MTGSWLHLPPVFRADIPEDLRSEFERLGETIVAQILGQPYALPSEVSSRGRPEWALYLTKRDQAIAWLREKRTQDERRRVIGERMEIGILVLVAIEAVPIVLHSVIWLIDRIAG